MPPRGKLQERAASAKAEKAAAAAAMKAEKEAAAKEKSAAELLARKAALDADRTPTLVPRAPTTST